MDAGQPQHTVHIYHGNSHARVTARQQPAQVLGNVIGDDARGLAESGSGLVSVGGRVRDPILLSQLAGESGTSKTKLQASVSY